MEEKKVTAVKKLKGFRSLTAMLISIIFILIAIPTIGLACLGVSEAVYGRISRSI